MKKDKNYKQRTYLDPIHGPIELKLNDHTDRLLAKIIDTKEFQRLRRIKQMGLGSFTFHGAEHTRFSHSLGTLFTAKKMINHFSKSFPQIKEHKAEILVTALLHDIGHGPFSHTSEKLNDHTHEYWTKKIIISNTSINRLLKRFNKKLPSLVIQTLENKRNLPYLSQIISSYIDCDRLDYLLRDSYFVGVPYGITNLDRIIASLEIDSKSKKIVVKETVGLDTIIHYLHARYSMYQQVYQHKKNLASDFLLKKIIDRAKEIKVKNISKPLAGWLYNTSIESYLQVDDYILVANIENWIQEQDKILSDLSNRFINRNLFKSLEFRQGITSEKINDVLEKSRKIAKEKNLHPKYYVGIEVSSSHPYEPYEASRGKSQKAVFIKQQNGQIKELSQISGLVSALSKENIIKKCLVFTPGLKDEISRIKGFKELFK
jgi:hypothetical protein